MTDSVAATFVSPEASPETNVTAEVSERATLHARAVELQTRMTDLERARSGQEAISLMATRRSHLQKDAEGLHKAVLAALALRAVGVSIEMDMATLAAHTKYWKELRDAQEADASYLLSESGAAQYRHSRRILQDQVAKLSAASAAAWAEATRSWLPSINDALLSVLGREQGLANTAAIIRRDLALLTVSAYVTPKTDVEARQFRGRCHELASLWQGLIGTNLPHEVAAFFEMMNTDPQRRVPLSLLTEGVRAWIEEKGIYGSFYVSV